MMTPGSKGHAFHACMKKRDFETRKNMRKKPFFEEKWLLSHVFRISRARSAEKSVVSWG